MSSGTWIEHFSGRCYFLQLFFVSNSVIVSYCTWSRSHSLQWCSSPAQSIHCDFCTHLAFSCWAASGTLDASSIHPSLSCQYMKPETYHILCICCFLILEVFPSDICIAHFSASRPHSQQILVRRAKISTQFQDYLCFSVSLQPWKIERETKIFCLAFIPQC